jgi:hypothetical protein
VTVSCLPANITHCRNLSKEYVNLLYIKQMFQSHNREILQISSMINICDKHTGHEQCSISWLMEALSGLCQCVRFCSSASSPSIRISNSFLRTLQKLESEDRCGRLEDPIVQTWNTCHQFCTFRASDVFGYNAAFLKDHSMRYLDP